MMKISEVIKRLENIYEAIGDVEVKIVESDGEWKIEQLMSNINFTNALIFITDKHEWEYKFKR